MSTKRYAEQMSLFLVLTLTLVLALGTYSYAGEGQKTSGRGQTGQSAQKRRSGSGTEKMQHATAVQRVSNLLDMDVQNRRGEKIGQIEDVVLTESGDQIDYVALSLDKGQMASRCAVPPDKLSFARDGQSVAFKGSVSSLGRRYKVGDDEWPQAAGESRMLKEDAAESRRVSDLLGMRVQGSDGEKVGQIEDLLIDLDSGQVKQAAIASGGFMGFNQKLSTVEWTSVDMRGPKGVASVDKTQQRLEQSATDSDEYWQQFGFEGEDGRSWKGSGSRSYRQQDEDKQGSGARSYRQSTTY